MNWLTNILRRLKGGSKPPSPDRDPDYLIRRAIEDRAAMVRRVDPGSSEAWSRLEMAMARGSGGWDRLGIPARSMVPRVAWSLGVVAACVVAVLLLIPRHRLEDQVLQTVRGQHTSIILSDSTEVLLNHTSRLTIRPMLQGQERRVSLEGEAFFRVKRNGSPFIVTTSTGTVQVLGTEFNVMCRRDNLEVALLHGKVRVVSGVKDSSVTLGPGQITVCPAGGVPESPANMSSIDYPGWIHDKLTFYHASMQSVCDELGDHFDVNVTLGNHGLADERITGTLDGHNISNSLAALSALTGHSYKYEDSAYILY